MSKARCDQCAAAMDRAAQKRALARITTLETALADRDREIARLRDVEAARLRVRVLDCGVRGPARCAARQADRTDGGFAYCWCRTLAKAALGINATTEEPGP